MKKNLTSFIASLIANFCIAQNEPSLIDNWRSYSIPTNPDTVELYNTLGGDWVVFKENNKVYAALKSVLQQRDTLPFTITPTETESWIFKGRRSFVKVADGYLVAFYRGEFGGGVYWFSKDGSSHHHLFFERVKQFIERDNKLYAIEGLAHLSLSEGGIIEIKKTDCTYQSQKYVELPTAPNSVTLDEKENFVVVTSKSLYTIDKKKNIDTLVLDGFWEYELAPNSIVVDKNIVYVGMRHGVFKYDLRTHKQEWLMKD